MRSACGFFFVAIWTVGEFILTPELKTTSPYVPWLQISVAAGLAFRRTLPLSALGIVILYGIAISQYGIFHLMDYPIFLGIAAYLALSGLKRGFFGAAGTRHHALGSKRHAHVGVDREMGRIQNGRFHSSSRIQR